MEPHELNRMFDQLAPSSEQEQAGLNRLLQAERKDSPMKKFKKLPVIFVAAVLMVTAAAAAVIATGLDRRLAAYFGAGEEQAELLVPGALAVDVTAEDNGAVLRVSQVLMDRYSILILADFTAPEGTVLDMHEEEDGVLKGLGGYDMYFLDENGAPIERSISRSWYTDILEDGDPLDNHLTLLFTLESDEGIPSDLNAAAFHIPAVNLLRWDGEADEFVTVYSGDWSCDAPLPEYDMGWVQNSNCAAGQLDGAEITLKEAYLSPMTLRLNLEREVPVNTENMTEEDEAIYSRWLSLVNVQRVTLTCQDGTVIPLEESGGRISDQEYHTIFRLTELTDPALFQGGTLTLRIGEQTCNIALDSLEPADG